MWPFFLISSMVLGVLDQLQIFWYLIELVGLLPGAGLATRAVGLDISKAFDRVWHTGLIHTLKSFGISGQTCGLISSFLTNRRLRVVLDGMSSQEYSANAGFPQGFILGLSLFLLYINVLPDDIICSIAIYADDTTLYCKCDQASDLWQQQKWLLNLNLIYETLNGAGSGLLISILEKLNLFRLNVLITLVLLM